LKIVRARQATLPSLFVLLTEEVHENSWGRQVGQGVIYLFLALSLSFLEFNFAAQNQILIFPDTQKGKQSNCLTNWTTLACAGGVPKQINISRALLG